MEHKDIVEVHTIWNAVYAHAFVTIVTSKDAFVTASKAAESAIKLADAAVAMAVAMVAKEGGLDHARPDADRREE